MADFQSGGMNQNVNAPVTVGDLLDDAAYRRVVHQIQAAVMCRTAAVAHGIDCGKRCMRAFERRNFLVDHDRGRALPAEL